MMAALQCAPCQQGIRGQGEASAEHAAQRTGVAAEEVREKATIPIFGVIRRRCELELHPIHAIDAVDEEDEDEDEGDLQSVLDFSHDGIFGQEAGQEAAVSTCGGPGRKSTPIGRPWTRRT